MWPAAWAARGPSPRPRGPEHRLAEAVGGDPAEEWKQKLLTYNLEDCAGPEAGHGVPLRRRCRAGRQPGDGLRVRRDGPPVASVEELDRLGTVTGGERSSSSTPTSSTSTAAPTSTTRGSGSTSAPARSGRRSRGSRGDGGTGNVRVSQRVQIVEPEVPLVRGDGGDPVGDKARGAPGSRTKAQEGVRPGVHPRRDQAEGDRVPDVRPRVP